MSQNDFQRLQRSHKLCPKDPLENMEHGAFVELSEQYYQECTLEY